MARMRLLDLLRRAHRTRRGSAAKGRYGYRNHGGGLRLPDGMAEEGVRACIAMKSHRRDVELCDAAIAFRGQVLCAAVARQLVQDAVDALTR